MTSDDVLSLSTSVLFVKLELGFGMSGDVKAVAYASFGKWEFSISLEWLLGRQDTFTAHPKPNPALCMDHKHRSLQREH